MDYFSLLPDELHIQILNSLDAKEWRATKFANYRLVARRYAAIGAQQMFESFQFRPTDEALDLMWNIIGAGLRKWVKVLDYDGKVVVEVGKKDGGRSGVGDEEMRTCVLKEVVEGFGGYGEEGKLEWLVTQNLPCAMFRKGYITTAFTASCANITVLLLSFSIPEGNACTRPDLDLSALPKFTASLKHLTELQLCFRPNGPHRFAQVGLTDVVPQNHTWPKLKLLMLESVHTTSGSLIALLSLHATSLQEPIFKIIDLVHPSGVEKEDVDWQRAWRQEGWRSVFAQLERMEVLKGGEVSGGDEAGEGMWALSRRGGAQVWIKTDLGEWLDDDWEGGDVRGLFDWK